MAKVFSNKLKRIAVAGFIVFSTIGCDQVTKLVARDKLMGEAPVPTLGGLLTFEHAQNAGAFLSLGADLSEAVRTGIFIVMVAAFLAFLAYYLYTKPQSQLSVYGYSLFLGGGVGNLIDRIWLGSVTDFILLSYGPLRTGIFNIADMAIILGFTLLFWDSFRPEVKVKTES